MLTTSMSPNPSAEVAGIGTSQNQKICVFFFGLGYNLFVTYDVNWKWLSEVCRHAATLTAKVSWRGLVETSDIFPWTFRLLTPFLGQNDLFKSPPTST